MKITLNTLQEGMKCINCGHNDRPLYPIPGAASPTLRGCAPCHLKFPGMLAREADRILEEALTNGEKPRCRKCKEIVAIADRNGGHFSLCSTCQQWFHQVFGAAA